MSDPPSPPRDEPFAALDTVTLYAIARLRADVFVVEQACAYPDLDGRDIEPATRHVWWDEGDGPLAYLRVLTEPDGRVRVGRVVTAASARRRGLADLLLRHVLATTGARPMVLDAQAHLVSWYRRHGFEPTGPHHLADGIPHVPMGLARATASSERTSSSEV